MTKRVLAPACDTRHGSGATSTARVSLPEATRATFTACDASFEVGRTMPAWPRSGRPRVSPAPPASTSLRRAQCSRRRTPRGAQREACALLTRRQAAQTSEVAGSAATLATTLNGNLASVAAPHL